MLISDDDVRLRFGQKNTGITVNLPPTAPERIAFVIRLEFDDKGVNAVLQYSIAKAVPPQSMIVSITCRSTETSIFNK